MSFVERLIDVEFQLGKGSFGEGGFDTVTLSGLRCRVVVETAQLPDMETATVQIWGMDPSIANRLSTLGGNPWTNGRNSIVTVSAGDSSDSLSQVFQGSITNGYQDFSTMPATAFVATALAGGLDMIKPSAATSYPVQADVATILASLAARATPSLKFENNGVSVTLATPYLSGTIIDQIRTVAAHANINAIISNGSLAIWPRNTGRAGAPISVSVDNGMVGYPTFNGTQIIGLRTLFNPALRYGSEIVLESSLKNASGSWYVGTLQHTLESLTPDGAWFTDLEVRSKIYIGDQPAY